MKAKYKNELSLILGFAIIAVAASDCSYNSSSLLSRFFHGFSPAIFYILAGATVASRLLSLDFDVVGFVRNKTRHVFVPYFCWSFLTLAIIYLISLKNGGSLSFNDAMMIIIGENSFGGYTFLWTLFMLYIIFTFVSRMSQNAWGLLILAAVLYSLYLIFDIYYCVSILKYAVFFAFGIMLYYYRAFFIKLMRYRILQAVVFLTVVLASMYHLNGLKWTYIFTAALGSWAVFCLGSYTNDKGSPGIKGIFSELGKYSYDIFLMYYPITYWMKTIFSGFFSKYIYLGDAVIFSVGIIAPYLLAKYILRRIPVIRCAFLGYNILSDDNAI